MKRTLATLALSAILAVGMAQGASAATSEDSAAWKDGLALCKPISDDGAYEECVVGSTITATGRALTSEDYHVNGKGTLTLDHATRPLTHTVSKPTKSDKARMVRANTECETVPNHTAKWSACITGAVMANGNDTHFMTGADWFAIRVRVHVGYTWKAYAVHASHTLVTPLP